jgi:hypothetical protein
MWIRATMRCHLRISALLRRGADPQDMSEGVEMSGEESTGLCGRDRAVLRAIDAGRCELWAGCEPVLVVDGMRCADSGVAKRLLEAGLVARPSGSTVAELTPAGRVAARLVPV